MANETEYEVTIKVSIFADSQGKAITEVENCLRPGLARDDRFALVVREIGGKLVKRT